MSNFTESARCRVHSDVREALLQARIALEASVSTVRIDPDAACDDLLAARLLIDTALVRLDARQ